MTDPVSGSAQRIDYGVNWNAPWLAPIRQLGEQVAGAPDWRVELNLRAAQLNIRNHAGLPLSFVLQEDLPSGVSYEAHIGATGKVPTRSNLHDFFNALVWLTFPRIKVELNALQAAQIAQLGIGKSRGPARDAATLFDENAAFLAVADNATGHSLVDALRSHQWQDVFVARRAQFQAQVGVFLFGHAMMEKLVNPYKAITAHSLVCWVDADFQRLSDVQKLARLDVTMARQLDRAQGGIELLPSVFSPLPVLGVPTWWHEQNAEFYADQEVFRPMRLRKS